MRRQKSRFFLNVERHCTQWNGKCVWGGWKKAKGKYENLWALNIDLYVSVSLKLT